MKIYVLIKKNSKRLVTDKVYKSKASAEDAKKKICETLAENYGNGFRKNDKTALAEKYAEWINVAVLNM